MASLGWLVVANRLLVTEPVTQWKIRTLKLKIGLTLMSFMLRTQGYTVHIHSVSEAVSYFSLFPVSVQLGKVHLLPVMFGFVKYFIIENYLISEMREKVSKVQHLFLRHFSDGATES